MKGQRNIRSIEKIQFLTCQLRLQVNLTCNYYTIETFNRTGERYLERYKTRIKNYQQPIEKWFLVGMYIRIVEGSGKDSETKRDPYGRLKDVTGYICQRKLTDRGFSLFPLFIFSPFIRHWEI